jgi:hypothetical protein
MVRRLGRKIMAVLIGLLGIAQVLGGIVVYFVANPTVHEILAAVMIGMGVISFGLGCLLERADRQIELLERIKSRS